MYNVQTEEKSQTKKHTRKHFLDVIYENIGSCITFLEHYANQRSKVFVLDCLNVQHSPPTNAT